MAVVRNLRGQPSSEGAQDPSLDSIRSLALLSEWSAESTDFGVGQAWTAALVLNMDLLCDRGQVT